MYVPGTYVGFRARATETGRGLNLGRRVQAGSALRGDAEEAMKSARIHTGISDHT